VTDTMARQRADRRRRLPGAAVAAVAALALALPALVHLTDGDRATVAIRNETEWDLGLAVRTGARSIMPIAAVAAGDSGTVREVLVPGETWELLWRFRGEVVGTTTVDHDDLVADGFVLDVPAEVTSALRAAGAPPTP
jgi:hypothetical protein